MRTSKGLWFHLLFQRVGIVGGGGCAGQVGTRGKKGKAIHMPGLQKNLAKFKLEAAAQWG